MKFVIVVKRMLVLVWLKEIKIVGKKDTSKDVSFKFLSQILSLVVLYLGRADFLCLQ